MFEPAFKAPHYIVIEGPIRVGKSTLAKALAENISARRIFDSDDNPFLSDFYDEKPGSAFAAQMHFLYERHRLLMEAEIENHTAPVVADFLFEKDKIFAYINLDNEELKLYEKYFDSFAPSVPTPDSGDLPASHAGSAAQARVEKRPARRNGNFTRISRRPSPTPTSIFSSAIRVRTCSSSIRPRSILSSATATFASCCAGCASPSKERNTFCRSAKASPISALAAFACLGILARYAACGGPVRRWRHLPSVRFSGWLRCKKVSTGSRLMPIFSRARRIRKSRPAETSPFSST